MHLNIWSDTFLNVSIMLFVDKIEVRSIKKFRLMSDVSNSLLKQLNIKHLLHMHRKKCKKSFFMRLFNRIKCKDKPFSIFYVKYAKLTQYTEYKVQGNCATFWERHTHTLATLFGQVIFKATSRLVSLIVINNNDDANERGWRKQRHFIDFYRCTTNPKIRQSIVSHDHLLNVNFQLELLWWHHFSINCSYFKEYTQNQKYSIDMIKM